MRKCSPPPNVSHVTCHMSHVTCHVSHVTLQMSRVKCHMSQSGEAYRWRVCYQRGLPRLVFIASSIGSQIICYHKFITILLQFFVNKFCLSQVFLKLLCFSSLQYFCKQIFALDKLCYRLKKN